MGTLVGVRQHAYGHYSDVIMTTMASQIMIAFSHHDLIKTHANKDYHFSSLGPGLEKLAAETSHIFLLWFDFHPTMDTSPHAQ